MENSHKLLRVNRHYHVNSRNSNTQCVKVYSSSYENIEAKTGDIFKICEWFGKFCPLFLLVNPKKKFWS